MTQFWMLWPDNPALSIFVLAVLAMVFLYAARKPMHDLIRALGALLGGPLRLAARWLIETAAEMKERNKAVLLAHGRQEPIDDDVAADAAFVDVLLAIGNRHRFGKGDLVGHQRPNRFASSRPAVSQCIGP